MHLCNKAAYLATKPNMAAFARWLAQMQAFASEMQAGIHPTYGDLASQPMEGMQECRNAGMQVLRPVEMKADPAEAAEATKATNPSMQLRAKGKEKGNHFENAPSSILLDATQRKTSTLLQPKNRKHRKDQKRYPKLKQNHRRQLFFDRGGCSHGRCTRAQNGARSHRLAFGSYGLKSLSKNQFNIRASQIEAVRKVIVRRTRKIGQI